MKIIELVFIEIKYLREKHSIMKKILVIKGSSQYQSTRVMADRICDAWTKGGHDVSVIDATLYDDESAKDVLIKNIVHDDFDLIFSINGIGFNLEYNGKKLMDWAKGKVLGMYVDIPIVHDERFANHTSQNVYASFIDQNHVAFVQKHYPYMRDRVLFLPHRGFSSINNNIEWESRKIDIFFPGTYHDYEDGILEIQNLPELTRNIAFELLDYMINNPNQFFCDAVSYILIKNNFLLSDDDLVVCSKQFYGVYRIFYDFYRTMVLETLLAAGVKVTVCGNGWDKFKSENLQNLIVLPSLSSDEVVDKMCDSKIVLNVSPIYSNGTHERIFSAMLTGAICITDSNPYLEGIFKNNEVSLYDICDVDTLPGIVKGILNSQDQSDEQTKRAFNFANAGYRWEDLATDILEVLEL